MAQIPITVRGDIEPRAVDQLRRCAEAGEAVAAAICADGHVGYSQPIGGVVAYPDHVSPSGVGYDIACVAAGTPVTTLSGCALPIDAVGAGAPVACWDGRRVRAADPVVEASRVERGRPCACCCATGASCAAPPTIRSARRSAGVTPECCDRATGSPACPTSGWTSSPPAA